MWQEKAACKPGDTALFFGDEDAQKEAKAICDDCSVRMQCRASALANGEIEGVWGGLTGAELMTQPGWRRRSATRERAAAGDDSRRAACGTYAGWQAHWRRGEPRCAPCQRAHSAYEVDRRRRQRQKQREVS